VIHNSSDPKLSAKEKSCNFYQLAQCRVRQGPIPAFGGGVLYTDRIKQDVDMATVRLNYTFGGPVVAKY